MADNYGSENSFKGEEDGGDDLAEDHSDDSNVSQDYNSEHEA